MQKPRKGNAMDETKRDGADSLTRIVFTKKQNAIIARALSMGALTAVFAIVGVILHYTLKFVSAHSSVLLPPIVAIILAKVVEPAYDRLRTFFWNIIGRRFLGLSDHHSFAVVAGESSKERTARVVSNSAALTVIFSALIIPLGVFLVFFGKLVVTQAVSLISALPDAVEWICNITREKLPDVVAYLEANNLTPLLNRLNPETWFDFGMITARLGTSAFSAWGAVRGFIGACAGWVVLPVYTMIYLASRPLEGADFANFMVGASDRTRENVRFLIDEFIRIVVAFFRGQVLAALIQGVLFGLGFQFIADVRYGMVLGLLLGLFNIVPYLGNILGLPLVGALAFFGADGGWTKLGLVLLVFVAVQTADGYIITPRVVGKRTGLNAFGVIFSLFFWSSVIGGALGMILAIPLSAFIVVLLRFIQLEYFSPPSARGAEGAGGGARTGA